MAITSFEVTGGQKMLQKYEPKSLYLSGDKTRPLSRITDKRLVKKKPSDYVSSLPLAASIYKASSGEFKTKQANKKIKKSVLTLPNQPAPAPQICTVSDMNDSEYYSQSNSNNIKPRVKKRSGTKNVRKSRTKNQEYEFYDRDERFCSEFNINIDSSSAEMMRNYKGDGRRISKVMMQKESKSLCTPSHMDTKPHDVWAVLRNLNRFPFQQSPPISEESIIGTKKKKAQNRRLNGKDTRVYETKEFAYISSYNVDSRSVSQSSSYDRVTVIDKQPELSDICQQYDDTFSNIRTSKDNQYDTQQKPKKRFKKKSSRRAFDPTAQAPNKFLLESKNEQKYDKHFYSIEDGVNSSLTKTDHRSQNTLQYSVAPTHSDYSVSTKDQFPGSDSNKLKGKYRAPQIKGISRVNISKTCEPIVTIPIRRPEVQQRKPRLVTTMPSACVMPKLTHHDIKRRIASIRFPLIILGREEVSSSVEVYNYDPPQFNGLEEHIWPFMVNWRSNKKIKREVMVTKDIVVPHYVSQINRKIDNSRPVLNSNRAMKNSKDVSINTKSKLVNNDLYTQNKNEIKKPQLYPETNCKRQQKKNQESISLLKDKMLNFLFQKSANGNIVHSGYNNNGIKLFANNKPTERLGQPICESRKAFETCTEAEVKSTVKQKYYEGQCIVANERKARVRFQQTKTQNEFEHPWAKAKRVHDFIEGVMNKITTGVYYSKEVRCASPNLKCKHAIDFAMQTDHVERHHKDVKAKVSGTKKQKRNSIPGFETSLPGLEIKTLNMNQIAIKHCVTNVMVQFDVADNISSAANSKPLPMTPVEGAESHVKIFKCKTTIVNAILPAELCSILPKLMKHIDSDIKTLRPAFCTGLINKSQFLSPISEMSSRVIDSTAAAFISRRALKNNHSLDHLSDAVKQYMNGMFFDRHGTNKFPKKLNPVIKYNCALLKETIPKNYTVIDILTYAIRLPLFKENKVNNVNQSKMDIALQKQHCPCTALELYTMKDKRIVPAFKPFNFEDVIRNTLINVKISSLNSTHVAQVHYLNGIMYVNITLTNDKESSSIITVISNNLYMNDLVPYAKTYLSAQNNSNGKCIKYIKPSTQCGSENTDQKSITKYNGLVKHKRRGFVRLYQRCKSATVMTTDKCTRTPLYKIQNLDDFIQVLGLKKILANVFVGNAEKKILSSIVQMKNWVTHINPKQALLLLLLMNKKDTPNLVRFRPILIQAIAVNRITRAAELDMEIEVIERENLNKFKEHEGISYLPATIENNNQLLEELYWIAKTTASDYQKPFDESSERLLKSLLEKRKKLNPSYLRVMARYVGLGLLKQPTKK